jgi:hypothetical protein
MTISFHSRDLRSQEEKIDLAIDKTHFRTSKKVIPHVKATASSARAIPERYVVKDATDKEIKKVNKRRPKDAYPHEKSNYYIPIFSSHHHGFQMDLLEQSSARPDNFPRYFLILININTKYGYAYGLESKAMNEIENKLEDHLAKNKIVSVICDEERAFYSQKFVDWLTDRNISIKFIGDKRHTALAVIDRFIRTLRDMNTPTVHGKFTSEHQKYRDFSAERMAKLLKIYNNTIHDSTKYTPKEMEEDPNLEKEFIIKKIYEKERRNKISDANLKEGVYVRYILPRSTLEKKRFKVSPECYVISHKEGNAYVIMAVDGTVLTVPRWRLFPLGNVKPKNIKLGKTFGNTKGTVTKILSKQPRNRYEVEFELPNGTKQIQIIPAINLRSSAPQLKSEIEKVFLKQLNNA